MSIEKWEECFELTARLHREIYSAEPDFRGPGIAALTGLCLQRPQMTIAEFEAVLRDSLERGSFRRLEWFCRDYPANLQRMKHAAPGSLPTGSPLPPSRKPSCGTCKGTKWVVGPSEPGKMSAARRCTDCS
jgi:hypothetical protein